MKNVLENLERRYYFLIDAPIVLKFMVDSNSFMSTKFPRF